MDRFGPIPTEADRLLKFKELQLAAQHWLIDKIHLEDRYVVFGYRNPRRINQLVKQSEFDLRIVDSHSAYLPFPVESAEDGDRFIEQLKSVLQPSKQTPYTPPLSVLK